VNTSKKSIDATNIGNILAVSTKSGGEFGMLEDRRSEETARRSAEAKQRGDSLLPPLGLAFWRAKRAFEREVGLSAAAWFLLSILIDEDGIS
jgi:hypothetical protein